MTNSTETNTKKPRPKWRWLKRGLFAMVVLITLLAAVVVFENWRGRRAWANYRAELEAKGEVLDWRKLVPQNIPDEQNFAKTPLLAPLTEFQLDPATGQVVYSDPDARKRIDDIFEGIQKVRGLGYWRKVEMTDWPAVQSELRSQTNSEVAEFQALMIRKPGRPVDDLQFLFSFSKDEMNEIAAAANRSYSSFGSRADKDSSVLLSQLGVVKTLAFAFVVRARVELLAGDTDAALADWQTATSLGEALDGDPLLISLLVTIAVTEGPLQVVWDGLAQHQWSDAQLLEIQTTLEKRNLVGDAARALRGERAFSVRLMDQTLFPGGPPATNPPGWIQKFLLPSIISQNKISMSRIYDEHALPLLDVGGNRVRVAGIDSSEQELLAALNGFAPYNLLARGLVPAVTKTLGKVANVQNSINMAMVACALERHWLAEGSYPAELNALVPRFLNSIPLDLDEQPLRYRLEPDGSFILYSVGIDLKDDQGRIGKEDGTFTHEEGDWVWKYPDVQKQE